MSTSSTCARTSLKDHAPASALVSTWAARAVLRGDKNDATVQHLRQGFGVVDPGLSKLDADQAGLVQRLLQVVGAFRVLADDADARAGWELHQPHEGVQRGLGEHRDYR